MSCRSLVLAPVAALAVFLSALAPAARAADPFYLDLLRDGTRALDDGSHAEAHRLLRLACFGMLEEPKLLADCLTRQALAEAGLLDREAFVGTYHRIAELERRFQAYSQGDLPEQLRQPFSDRAVAWVPASDLLTIPGLAEALDRKRQAEIAALPAAQRRARLGELLLESPGDATWPAMLAELELADGNAAAARAAAETVLALEPDDDRARCLLGRALAGLGQCEQALTSLDRCPSPDLDPAAGIDEATCLAALERWDQAAAVLAALPPQVRQSSPVRSLENRVGKQQAKAAAEAEREARSAGAEEARLEKEAQKAAQQRERAEARAAARQPRSGDQEPPPEQPPPGAGNAASRVAQTPIVPDRDAATGAPPVDRPTSAASSPTASPVSDQERATLARALDLAARATVSAELERPIQLARPIADRHPDDAEAQYVVAEVAYRSSDWSTAIEYFDRGGDPGADRPILLFYQAVALFESGQPERAGMTLRRCLPNLKRDPWIDSYVERILGGEARRP
ncbi:MAG TPA: tetratricopeptide repeat protein [Thermoanaerobaculia bacterium]|nr:tetratricopeptide repeat protein [Thermoanaerobaculia bacterium]